MALKLDHLTICVSDWQAYERHYGTLLPMVGFRRASETIWARTAKASSFSSGNRKKAPAHMSGTAPG
jgi:hypothetical protein